MAEKVNVWNSYFEKDIEDRDPVLDDPIIYEVNHDHFTLTVYSPDGRVSKYWNARVLKDELGYCRIACPREKKILYFNWFNWSAFFCQSGMKELVMMPDSSCRTVTTLMREVK